MRSPDVSIIITNYNYGKFLARCVRSCLAQKNVSVEVIVVDDCSADNSLKTLDAFKNDIKIISNKENVGVATAANMGIEAAKSQFVIRVDADDFVDADMCHIMSKHLISNHDAFCVSCDYFIVDEHENVLERKYIAGKYTSSKRPKLVSSYLIVSPPSAFSEVVGFTTTRDLA